MPSTSVEVGSSSSSSVPSSGMVQVFFPSAQASVLDSLNRQREDGQLCDLSIHVQGQVFKAHRCVLAASSPYFHDQVLLKNMSTVSIPAVMDPLAFESVLSCAYTGQLRMLREDIVNYLTVGSVLQMWHIVDKCTELLKEGRVLSGVGNSDGGVGGGGVQTRGGQGEASSNAGCSSSSNGNGVPAGSTDGVQAQVVESQQGSQRPARVSVSESQSPSSTNYFSPREGSSFGSSNATTVGAAADAGGTSTTLSYCPLSGGGEALLMGEDEEEEEEEVEDNVLYNQRQKRGGSGKRKKNLSEQEDGVSDSFGVSSYQDGEESVMLLPRRPTYSQPSIMPRKQWVVVKTERPEEDDHIVVSGEEGEGYEEDEDEREIESDKASQRKDFNISNIRSLSGEPGGRSEENMDSPMDYCQSSEDYLKFDGSLMEQTLVQHLPGQTANRTVSALLSQVQSAATARAQLFPLDMQGNQILLYSQTSGLSLDAPASGPPLGMAGGLIGAAAFKGLEHGAVHLSVPNGLGLDGMEGGTGMVGASGSGGTGVSSVGSGKVFMCHCGKTFTHKSMRDRHINMHLDLRPFNCPVCAKKFKMKHHLTEHMKTHTGLKPYDCTGCGKKFMWRDSFMRHRSNCERHGRPEEREEVGNGCDGRRRGGGGGGEDGPDWMSSPHLLLQNGEGGSGNANVVGVRRGAGTACGASPNLSSNLLSVQQSSSSSIMATPAAAAGGALLVPQSPGQGHVTGIFSGLVHSVSSEEVSDVSANDSSLT